MVRDFRSVPEGLHRTGTYGRRHSVPNTRVGRTDVGTVDEETPRKRYS